MTSSRSAFQYVQHTLKFCQYHAFISRGYPCQMIKKQLVSYYNQLATKRIHYLEKHFMNLRACLPRRGDGSDDHASLTYQPTSGCHNLTIKLAEMSKLPLSTFEWSK